MISSFKFELIELFLLDLSTSIKADVGMSNIRNPNITIIYIDSETVEKYHGYPSYEDHRILLEKLSPHISSYIVYNLRQENKDLIEITGNYLDKEKFANTAKSLNNLYFITEDLELKGQEQNLRLNAPLDILHVVPGPRTNDAKLNPKNKISRRVLISYQGQPLIHHQIASKFNPDIADPKNINGKFEYIGTDQIYINFHPQKSFPSLVLPPAEVACSSVNIPSCVGFQ